MRSPLSHPSRPYHSRQQICKILPNQGKVECALRYDCELELYIASHTYNDVSVRITHPHVYNFWNCLIEDKQRVYDILLSDWFKFGKQDFHMLQKDWSTWTDPFHRAALFFILSAASSNAPSRFHIAVIAVSAGFTSSTSRPFDGIADIPSRIVYFNSLAR